MRLNAFLLSSLIQLLCSLVVAQVQIASPDSACNQSQDPSEAGYRFTAASKKFSSQCIDTHRFRSIQNLQVNADQISLNNFHSDNKFWQAQFDSSADNVSAVYFQVVRFPILGVIEAAHVQLRFQLNQPVQLTQQTDTTIKAETSNVLISFEAARPKDQPYNFALGALQNYALVARVASVEQKLKESEAPFEQYELSLSAEERSELLKAALVRAANIGMKFTYNTLRPNCTSEAFDLIDQLPRLAGKHPRFLTVISNDPVAQPSIDALIARELIRNRVQNFEEELQGVQKTLPVPARKAKSFLPEVANHPWSVVLVTPDLERLSPQQKQIVADVKTAILNSAPDFLQKIGSGLTSEAGGDAAQMIITSMQALQAALKPALSRANAALPQDSKNLALYIVPFRSEGRSTPVEVLGVPAALPFPFVERAVDETLRNSQEVYYHIAEGARKAADVGAVGQQLAYPMGLSIQVRLVKDAASINSQVLLGLRDQDSLFTMLNSQVNFSRSVVTGNQSRSTRPVVLITHKQDLNQETNSRLKVEFGAEGGIAGRLAGQGFGAFQIRKEMSGNCQAQALSSPTLIGVLGQAAVGKPILDRLLQGKNVAFHILSADLDLESLAVKAMDVKVATWPLHCVSNEGVNQQFQDNANQMLEKFQQEAKGESALQKLLEKIITGYKN